MVQQPVESLLARSWRLLNANWRIIVPGLVSGIVAGIIIGIFELAGYQADKNTGSAFGAMSALASSVVWIVATLVSIAYTTGMASAAWQTGTATYADGRRAFREDSVKLLVTMVALTLIAVIAVLLAVPTLGLSLLAFVFFFIYAIPAVVVDGRGALEALADSCRVASQNFISTVIITIVIGALGFAALLPMGLLSIVPFVGPVLSAVLLQAVTSFFTLLVVGAYIASQARWHRV